MLVFLAAYGAASQDLNRVVTFIEQRSGRERKMALDHNMQKNHKQI